MIVVRSGVEGIRFSMVLVEERNVQSLEVLDGLRGVDTKYGNRKKGQSTLWVSI